MIFVTVGTEKYPFDRLLKTLDEAVEHGALQELVFGQIGNSNYQPRAYTWAEFLSFKAMEEYIRRADIVVAHAGVGTMLLALSLGKVPILMPRRSHLGEHLDEHQVEFSRKIESTGKVLIAYTPEDLVQKIIHYDEWLRKLKQSSFGFGKQAVIRFLDDEMKRVQDSAVTRLKSKIAARKFLLR